MVVLNNSETANIKTEISKMPNYIDPCNDLSLQSPVRPSTISVSLHSKILGKPVAKTITKAGCKPYKQLYCNNINVNLSEGWLVITTKFEDIFYAISEIGYAIAPVFEKNYRTTQNFKSCQLILVDIDHGMTLDQLSEHDYYLNYGAGYYTSPSHTFAAHRFRIIFLLEKAVTDSDEMRAIYTALIGKFGGDAACKDPARLFYGSIKAHDKECRDNFIPISEINNLIADGRNLLACRTTPAANTQYFINYVVDKDEQKLIVDALSRFTFNYDEWCSLGWGMYNSGFSYTDFTFATNEDSPQSQKLWKDAYIYKDVGMGSVRYILKNHMNDDEYRKLVSSIDIERGKQRLNLIKELKIRIADNLKNLANSQLEFMDGAKCSI